MYIFISSYSAKTGHMISCFYYKQSTKQWNSALIAVLHLSHHEVFNNEQLIPYSKFLGGPKTGSRLEFQVIHHLIICQCYFFFFYGKLFKQILENNLTKNKTSGDHSYWVIDCLLFFILVTMRSSTMNNSYLIASSWEALKQALDWNSLVEIEDHLL
jgi:hypothetical protein